MKKSNVMIKGVTTEKQSELLDQSKLLHSNVTVVAALTVILLAAPPFVLYQQQSRAQEQQQQQSQANLTSVEQRQLMEDIMQEILA